MDKTTKKIFTSDVSLVLVYFLIFVIILVHFATFENNLGFKRLSFLRLIFEFRFNQLLTLKILYFYSIN